MARRIEHWSRSDKREISRTRYAVQRLYDADGLGDSAMGGTAGAQGDAGTALDPVPIPGG